MKSNKIFTCIVKNLVSSVTAAVVSFGLMGSVALAQEVPQEEVKATLKTDNNGVGSLVVEARGIPPKAPLFFTARAEHVVTVSPDSVKQVITINYKKLQGANDVMSLVLKHKSDVKSVKGVGLKEWAVRELEGTHYLDVRMLDPQAKVLTITVTAERLLEKSASSSKASIMTLTNTESSGSGFSEAITIIKKGVQLDVIKALGCISAKPLVPDSLMFFSNGTSNLELRILRYEGDYAGVDLRNVTMRAVLDSDGKSAIITLTGTLHVREVSGKPFTLVRGKVALSSKPYCDGGQIHVRAVKDEMECGVICKQLGIFPVRLEFAAPITTGTGWNTLQFTVPNGAVVPLHFGNLNANIEFRESETTHLDFYQGAWQGMLPASGLCSLHWKIKPKTGDGELFYTSNGVSEVSIGSGLMHTSSTVTFKVLQGKMDKVELDLRGSGEVVSVIGTQVASWKVKEAGDKKVLECILKSATSDMEQIRIATQFPLGKFPTKVEPLSVTPLGTMRHSGFIRVSNKGAVRVETSITEGLMQLSPDKFPQSGKPDPNLTKARQVFVYRYPSAERKLEISADQIISEVAVSHITTYEMSETDRVIQADIEIDITEAGLRDWSFLIPADYSVSGISSANMVDHVASTTVEKNQRSLKILFKDEVTGRQLIKVRLEKNLPASMGDWSLPSLTFPGAKNVRGDIGILSASGWKMQPVKASVKNLDERPLAYFPKNNNHGERLQHAYRSRSSDWSATFEISAKGQSIQSDLLHLYHLKEGILEAKILVYYFVIGAPASEWKLQLPAGAENVSVEGQNVRTWDQEDDVLTVTLNQPVLGASKLLVTYEESMDPNGGKINIGSVTPLGVQSESGFIHLVSSQQVKKGDDEKSGNLLSISPLEMPSEHRVLTSIPSIAAWQYAARPYTLAFDVEPLEIVKSLEQAVGAASLHTRITSDGEVVTNAEFLVNTRGKKALRIKLPTGNKIWTAKADGELINARIDGDQLILPLPPTKDSNRYRTLEIRYGGMAENPSRVTVGPPVLSAPLTIAEWKVTGDNHLTPTGGNVKPLQMQVPNNGFTQIRKNYRLLAGVIFLMLGGIFLLQKKITDKWLMLFGNLWIVAAIISCLVFGGQALDTEVTSLKEFDVVAPVVSDQEIVSLELANHASGPSSFSGFGIFLMIVGVGLLVVGLVKENLSSTLVRSLAVLVILLGCLMHVGGAAYFYFFIAILGALLLAKGMPKLINRWKFKPSKPAVVASMILFSLMGLSSEVKAANNIADSIQETWQITEGKLTSTQQIIWQAEAGESLEILRAPAVLLDTNGTGFRVIKVQSKVDKTLSWKLIAEESGVIEATVRYQASFLDKAELACDVPSGYAAVKLLSVTVDQKNWQISSPQSVRSEKLINTVDNTSGVRLNLMGLARATVILKPMPRDRSKEALRFLAEVADIYVPAPGVLDGRHKVKIKPLAGELKELIIDIPDGLMVGNVACSEIDSWRFDAKKKTLTVTLRQALSQDCELVIMTQRGVKAYPQDLILEPITVRGAANTVGAIGYGFGEDSQPDNAKVMNLLEINIADFDVALLKSARELQPKFVLHKAYRYGVKRGKINLRVAAVSPEIRVESRQTIRLTDERMSLQVEALANITRAGVFELKFTVPVGLTVESVNGAALRDWNVVDLKGRQLATLYLNGRTMGQQRFTIAMLGESPEVKKDANKWDVPRWELENVSRQRGSMILIPDHGIRLRVVDRMHASQIDSKNNTEQNKGSLAFRLLQKDWKISLAVQKLDPWITAEILQQVSVREGHTKNWMNIHYNVDHAVVKQFQLRIPGIGKEHASTLRASGPTVKEIVHHKDDIWQINLRRGMIGGVPVQIGYQNLKLRDADTEVIAPVQLLDTKQSAHYMAVRAPSRLEVQGSELREWRSFDWSNVPSKLYSISDRSEPSLCYRVVDVERNMPLTVKRHSMAGTLKLRVASGEMRTMFNADGSALSRLSLAINVAEKSSLRISLPAGAELFNVIVNDKSVEVVREGDAYSFLVTEAIQSNQPAKVQITYQMKAAEESKSSITLLGPTLSIPLENIDWYVMLPDGYDLNSYKGGFDYLDTISNEREESYSDEFKKIKQARYLQLREEGKLELDRAMDFSNSGDLDKANAALTRVYYNQAVDAASNEDARVKLERNMTSQAIMGLNTRSQKSYMDNKAMGNTQRDNDALEEAVSRNPFFMGSTNFNPNQLGDYMQGNSDEEILAMQRIARKLVKPQLISTDAEQAVELEILNTNKVLHFHKDLHLSGDSELAIEIELDQTIGNGSGEGKPGSSFGLILILAITSFLGIWLAKK